MIGIKKHTHEQKLEKAKDLVPQIKKRFGDNLSAIAIRGSTARNTDGPYSDLEMFAFLRERPEEQQEAYGKERKIQDGLLVELLWVTKEVYIQEVKEISPVWFGSGADYLLSLHNEDFVQDLNSYQPVNVKEKCLAQAVALWPAVEKAGREVVEIARKQEFSRIALAMLRYYDNVLNLLSFINQTPFTSYSRKIQEAENFKIKPGGFSDLTQLMVEGDFNNYDLIQIKTLVTDNLSELKSIVENYGGVIEECPDQTEKKSDRFGLKDKEKRYEQIAETWDKVQESTTKVLNAAAANDHLAMTSVINDMFYQHLKILSCLIYGIGGLCREVGY